ncbi:MAG: hypothetical protein GKR88_13820 [Flavobacteriaceae bacterium]|nr:MAG: hypothetical protein GKR88_13820 [Flavobacteriaceae bacterium]
MPAYQGNCECSGVPVFPEYFIDPAFIIYIEFNEPTVVADEVDNITSTTAQVESNLTSECSSIVTEKGVCWSTVTTPTINNNFLTSNNNEVGEYSIQLTGLSPSTTYYVRAYVKYNNQYVYSNNEASFTTECSPSTYNGNITLTTQQQVDDFGANCYTEITGNLFIENSTDIQQLDALNSISILGGGLKIHNNSILSNINGLNSLNSIGYYSSGPNRYTVRITNNSNLLNVDGLSNLNASQKSITINSNNSLVDINGLNEITTIGDVFTIVGNDSLTSIDGLNNLIYVASLFDIENNSSLTSISGFNSLTTIEGISAINNNSNLIEITGLNSLNSIGLNSFHYLAIQNNTVLTNISGISNLMTLTGNLQIKTNSSLSNLCAITSLINNGGATGSKYQVENNAYNPTRQDIIDGNCSQ